MTTTAVKTGYKQTDIGVIPADWDDKKIIDVAPLQRGFDLPTSQLKSGPFPVVYSNGILNFHNKAMAKAPGVVTGRSGTIGKVNFIERDYWPHNTTLWVTNFKGNDEKYIYYLYSHINIEKFSTGSGVPTLNRNDVHAFEVGIPKSKIEQTAIATALSDADTLISKLELLIEKRKNIKQGAMQELLTGKRRLPRFSGEWCLKSLGQVLKIRHGKSQKNIVSISGKYPILATGGVIGRTDEYLYNQPSVLIGRKGTIDLPQFMDTPFWTVDTLFYTEINQENDAKFIFYKFRLIDWYSYNEASGVPSLNAKTIERIETLMPPTKSEQTAIAAILSDMDTEIGKLESQLIKYQNIKQGMMQTLLTGKIRLLTK